MVSQRQDATWMGQSFQPFPEVLVLEATKPSMIQHDDALEDTFWRSVSPGDSLSEDELTDEAASDHLESMARVPTQDFRFYHEGQRLKEDTEKEFYERMAAQSPPESPSRLEQRYTYLSFAPADSDTGRFDAADSCSSVVVLSECDEEVYSDGSKTSSSHSPLPARPPSEDESSLSEILGSTTSTRRLQGQGHQSTPNRLVPSSPKHITTSCSRKSRSKHSRGTGNKSTATRQTQKSSSSAPTRRRAFSSQTGRTTITTLPGSIEHESTSLPLEEEIGHPQSTQIMPRQRNMKKAAIAEDEHSQANLLGKWQRRCETLWAPIFFDLWEEFEAKDGDDDATLKTYEEERSYEDEGYVNVLVAIQATVLGTDFPEVLEMPKKDIPFIWGNNFVGIVQPPKGRTVHSRKFPQGSRVASISAWSATAAKPYITCNTSHLLTVPPIDGTHLDCTEVAVVVAAYLPAFQAIHHGQRVHRHMAYEPAAFEGQRILILSHGHHNSVMHQSLADARVQAAVRLVLWAGARDVHITTKKAGNAMRNVFGNDYRVRLLDTPADDWVPMLKQRIHLVLDFTPSGFSFDPNESTFHIAEEVMALKGRYVGFLGEDCSSHALDCREEGPADQKKQSTWKEGLSFLQGKRDCSGNFLPEARDIQRVVEWTTMCMKLKRASLFDFISTWKQDRRLAERDFSFLLEVLAKRKIRPHISKIVEVDDFPVVTASEQPRGSRSMSGAVVCEPWSQVTDSDGLSCCSSLS